MAISVDLDAVLDEPYRSSALSDLVGAPVAAFSGISDEEAAGLAQAFGIQTIGDLAANSFVQAAIAIVEMAKVAQQPPTP